MAVTVGGRVWWDRAWMAAAGGLQTRPYGLALRRSLLEAPAFN